MNIKNSTEEMIDEIFNDVDHADDKGGELKLIIFSGNIGGGKSTLCRKLANIYNATVINKDSMLESITSCYGKYDSDKVEIYDESEEAIIRIAFKLGQSVIIDRLCYTKLLRKRFIDIGKEFKAKIISYDFGSGNETTLARRIKNNRGIPARMWTELFNKVKTEYEIPAIEEGFDELKTPPTDKEFVFFGFDLDGTIFDNSETFTNMDKFKPETVNLIRKLYRNPKNIIIIWTCRDGDILNEALKVLRDNNIYWDYVNENPLSPFPTSVKPFFNILIDDRVINVEDLDKFDDSNIK